MSLLDTFSSGWSHIQSADPFYAPNVTTNSFDDSPDVYNWFTLMQVGHSSGSNVTTNSFDDSRDVYNWFTLMQVSSSLLLLLLVE